MIKRYLVLFILGVLITSLGCSANVKEGELTVNYKLVNGECLYEKNWSKVSGRIVSWVIKNQGSNLPAMSHSYSFLGAEGAPQSSSIYLPKLKYFSLINPFSSFEQAPFFKNEISFLNKEKKELGSNDLELAQLIFEVDESSLYRLNSSNKEISFRESSYAKVLIPGAFTVCRLQSNVLMKDAKAKFSKNGFGRVSISEDDTTSVHPNQKSFAVDLLKNIY